MKVGSLVILTFLASTVPAMQAGETGERKDWSWTVIDDRGLALGGGGLDEDDIRDLHARGFRAIVNYRAEHPDNETALRDLDMDYLFLPNTYAEEDTMPLAHVHEAVEFLEKSLAAGRPVFVHCTGGWHRSVVGVVAFVMKERGMRFEEAFAHVAKIRPGIEPRYSDVLYEYERHLFGGKKLTVDMWTTRWDVAPGERVNVTIGVTHDGAPVQNARVAMGADHYGTDVEVTTGPDGRATVPFTVHAEAGLEYVHALARAEGYVNGYDRSQFWIGEAKTRLPTTVEVEDLFQVSPGAEVAIPFKLTESDGDRTNARVTLTGACRTFFRAYSGWDGAIVARFTAPLVEGDYALRAVATRFPAEPVERTMTLVVGNGGPAPSCSQTAPPDRAPAVNTSFAAWPTENVPDRDASAAPVWILLAALVIALKRRSAGAL